LSVLSGNVRFLGLFAGLVNRYRRQGTGYGSQPSDRPKESDVTG
jgi:hypothetical protein